MVAFRLPSSWTGTTAAAAGCWLVDSHLPGCRSHRDWGMSFSPRSLAIQGTKSEVSLIRTISVQYYQVFLGMERYGVSEEQLVTYGYYGCARVC